MRERQGESTRRRLATIHIPCLLRCVATDDTVGAPRSQLDGPLSPAQTVQKKHLSPHNLSR